MVRWSAPGLAYQVGGELPELIGEDFAQELINYTDKIYLEFGADPHVEGIYEGSEIKEIRKRAIQPCDDRLHRAGDHTGLAVVGLLLLFDGKACRPRQACSSRSSTTTSSPPSMAWPTT